MTLLSRSPLANAASFIANALRDGLEQVAVDALQEASPHLLGVQSQHVADRWERERPAIVARAYPTLCLAEQLATVVVASSAVFVKAGRRIE